MYYKVINSDSDWLIFNSEKNEFIPHFPANSDWQIFLQYLADNELTLDSIPLYNTLYPQ